MLDTQSSTGVPALPQHYECSEGVESSHNYSHHHMVNVEHHVPSQQHSPHTHSPNLSIPRAVSNHSTVIQSSNTPEGSDQSHYHFHPPMPVPQSPYPPNVNNQSTQYYQRQENANYSNSPNTPHAMSLNTGLPYISKMSQIPPSRRPTVQVSSHELVPIPNRSRLSPGISSRYSQMSLVKSDSPEGLEIPRHISQQSEPSGSPSCTAFISKLYHLCGHDEYRSYIRWNSSGDAFVLAHANTEFATMVLPKFFRHSNVSSFVRQLNLYNFTRLPTIKLLDHVEKQTNSTASTSSFSGFSHPHFRRGDEDSLGLIKPKPNKNKMLRKLSKCPPDEKSLKGIRKNAKL